MLSHTALEDRDQMTPPSDSLAEAVVLQHLLSHPDELALYDVRPLLVFPEHRACLDAMHSAYNAAPDVPWGRFYIRWLCELERACPGRGELLEHTMNLSAESESAWRWKRYDEDRIAGVPIRAADYSHDGLWWLERLKRIAESRRLIAAAQDMAARGWRGDVDGAHSVAEKVVQSKPRAPIRIDL